MGSIPIYLRKAPMKGFLNTSERLIKVVFLMVELSTQLTKTIPQTFVFILGNTTNSMEFFFKAIYFFDGILPRIVIFGLVFE